MLTYNNENIHISLNYLVLVAKVPHPGRANIEKVQQWCRLATTQELQDLHVHRPNRCTGPD